VEVNNIPRINVNNPLRKFWRPLNDPCSREISVRDSQHQPFLQHYSELLKIGLRAITPQKKRAAVVVIKIYVNRWMSCFCHFKHLRSHFGTGFGTEGDNNLLAVSGFNPVTVT
jgi:hypothetical protein